jgi:hypothetical protein
MGYKAVRNERWKYIHYLELEGMDELYDLKTDPYEMKNLIAQPGAVNALAEMKQEMERLLKETTANPKSAIAEKFIGTWKLVSYESRDANGVVTYPFGQDAIGYIMYDGAGHMAVQFMRASRAKFTARPPAAEEARQAFSSYVAYFARYEVNEKEGVVIHHIEGSLNPNVTGTDYIRYYDFEGDKLTLTPTQRVDNGFRPKSAATLRLTWRRIK